MKKTWLEIAGLIFALGYIVTFLGIWMIGNYLGYEVVRFTEPVYIIKYSEWGMGIFSIIILLGLLKKRIDNAVVVRYDPPV